MRTNSLIAVSLAGLACVVLLAAGRGASTNGPSGPPGSIQTNDNGMFGGGDTFTWDGTNLRCFGEVALGDINGDNNGTLLEVSDGNHAITLQSGLEFWYFDAFNHRTASSVKHFASKAVVITDSSEGFVLRSLNGHFWRITITDSGELDREDIGTGLP